MPVKDLTNAIKKATAELISSRPKEVQKISLNVLALVKKRIQGKGESATGEQFKDYVIPYKKFRKKRGKQVNFYDATFSGAVGMMARTFPEVVKHNKTETVITFTARTQFDRNKLEWQNQRNNRPLLEPSKKELELAEKANRERVLKILRKFEVII